MTILLFVTLFFVNVDVKNVKYDILTNFSKIFFLIYHLNMNLTIHDL